MNNRIQISLIDAFRLYKTKKQFILFEMDNNNKITEYRLTDKLTTSDGRHWSKFYKHMRLTDVIKREIKYLSINN